MIIWNHQHGWPTLAHTLGHLGAPGGDHDAGKDDHFTLMWPLSLIGAQLGAVGIPALLAMGIACAWAWRRRRTDPDRWPARLWLICCSMPAVGFFVLLSFFKPVLGGWPFPSYVPLVALVAEMAVLEFGSANRTFINIGKVIVVYGVIGWLVLSFPNFLAAIPVVGANFEKSVIKRIVGHRQKARQLQAMIDANRDEQGRPPLVITRYYMDAALDAFYLPGHPNVYNAGTLTGQRPTSYDFWPANDLSAPSLLGRIAILDGHSPTRPWEHILRFESIDRVDDSNRFIGRGYGGLARHQP
jgi:hypothetical protein